MVIVQAASVNQQTHPHVWACIRRKKMSKTLKACHDLSMDLYAIGAMDAITMQMMDALCQSPHDIMDVTENNGRETRAINCDRPNRTIKS
jgi:hypothetical protein